MPVSNLDRFKNDINRLIEQARDLQLAMIMVASGRLVASKMMKDQGISDKEIEKAKSKAGEFGVNYQSWYSECIALIKQILPDRLQEFKALYERPTNRK